jgi:prevent-host-death family protein
MEHMSYTVSIRELRNRTAEVVRRAEAGETAVLTANGRPVAQIVPVPVRPRRASAERLRALLDGHLADPGLRDDLAALFPGTTDDA